MRLEVRMAIVLVVTSLVAAGVLAVVYAFTSTTIADQKDAARQEALKMLLPEAYEFKPDTVVVKRDTSVIYLAYDSKGRKIGLVFTAAKRGYAGPVETMVGVRKDSIISGIRIASPAEGLKETPGLGTRVLEDWFKNQFKGLKHDDVYLRKEGGKIEAITAATISSNAVTSGVREGLKRYLVYLSDYPSIREVTAKGYIDSFKVLVHLDASGRIMRVEIPKAGFNETSGIGARCLEAEFLSRFVGLSKTEDAQKVEAVTGATLTSNAIKNAAIKALSD